MNTNSCIFQVGNIEALVVRKPIKNLHLSVLPPNGAVRVSAPLHMTDDVIKVMLATKTTWILRQKAKFDAQERQAPREYVSGESHYFLGKRYKLDVVYEQNRPQVSLKGKNKIIMQVRPGSDVTKREALLAGWYRRELKVVAGELIEKYQEEIGVQAESWGIKKMKTRWGTCSQKSKKVWINLELAKKPTAHIEYVVVHELIHLIEMKHNKRFVLLMTQHLPKWKSIKEDLNRFILSHEEWSYPDGRYNKQTSEVSE